MWRCFIPPYWLSPWPAVHIKPQQHQAGRHWGSPQSFSSCGSDSRSRETESKPRLTVGTGPPEPQREQKCPVSTRLLGAVAHAGLQIAGGRCAVRCYCSRTWQGHFLSLSLLLQSLGWKPPSLEGRWVPSSGCSRKIALIGLRRQPRLSERPCVSSQDTPGMDYSKHGTY